MDEKAVPSFEDLRALEAVASSGSVNAAALKLGLSNGAVSRRLSNLTRVAGVPLLLRSGRGVELSPAGKTLAESGARAIEQVMATLHEINVPTDSKSFYLGCEHVLAARWLAPRLSVTPIKGMDLTLCFQLSGSHNAAQELNVDVSIGRSDMNLKADWQITPFSQDYMGPVMLPGLYEKVQSTNEPVANIVCKGDASLSWMSSNPMSGGGAGNTLVANQLDVIDTALTGAGIGIASFVLVEDHIRAGRLVAPYGFTPTGVSYVLIEKQAAISEFQKTSLLAWLKQQIEESLEILGGGQLAELKA